MKKIFSKVPFLAYCILGTTMGYSQLNSNDIASLDISKKPKTEFKVEKNTSSSFSKATSVLNAMFPNATNITWATYGKGLLLAYLETPGKKHRAGFDKKGNFVYAISSYKEEQLPQSVLLKVKQTYFGKNIFCVTEVNYDGKTAYLIILEDKTSWLHIKIIGDEMIEEKVLLKA